MRAPPPSSHPRTRWRRRRSVMPRGVLRRAALLPGIVWAAPLSLIGLLLALPVLCTGGRLRALRRPLPGLLISGALADRLLRWHPYGRMSAIAIGHVILVDRLALRPRLLRHELEHVRQAMRWGPLFPIAYLAASTWVWLHRRDPYWHNPFEIAARDAERRG